MKKARFITLEGIDGCGKSTQAKLLAARFKAAGSAVLFTREPGGTSLAESLRSVILNPRLKIHPLAELFLYEASRAQHTAEVIRPALAKGKIVVSDRFTDATTAYQGYGRKIPIQIVERLNQTATGGLKPDLTLLLNVSQKFILYRTRERTKDRMEKEKGAFQRRVKAGYRAIARREPARVKTVNGEGTISEVAERIWQAVHA
ncbi:MAG: dTMP kinase [Elusimicrobia bacterium RIFCSPLOWO2_01_FULL_54_10]|nr:MAG: dTMP kinase [Elusimicrobia bacterium RIFCSPLOWO2_01_FULL_54_10]